MHHLNRGARLLGFGVLSNGENAWQAGKRIAAQGVVDELLHDDAGVCITKPQAVIAPVRPVPWPPPHSVVGYRECLDPAR